MQEVTGRHRDGAASVTDASDLGSAVEAVHAKHVLPADERHGASRIGEGPVAGLDPAADGAGQASSEQQTPQEVQLRQAPRVRREQHARQWREHERGKLHERLVAEGVLHADGDYTPGELRAAVHALICRSPSVLVGLALDDLSGETEPVNVPGVGPDRFASWTRKMREPIEVITTSSETTLTIHCGERHRPTDG